MSEGTGGRRARAGLALALSIVLLGAGAYLVVGQVLAARATSSLRSATSAPARTPAATTRGGAASQPPATGTGGGTAGAAPASGGSGAPSGVPASQRSHAPNGQYTTETGTTATIASLRGEAVLVWFVAGGCASCAASIPAVAAHLAQIRATGVRVLTLGLYGDFPAASKGVASLLAFGRSAAGSNVERPGWSWGMASRRLSMAYDPFGVPDVYVLIGPDGTLRYRNSAPVSTMSQLLAAARRVGHRPAVATDTAASVPCC